MGLAHNIYTRLFTKEDHFNAHKTIGISCLVSFVFRFVNAGESDMAFDTSMRTVLTIVLHAMLSLTSLIFRIPSKRIVGGYRIWPEYRLHSIVFAMRSLIGMALTWYELRRGLEPNYLLNAAIVIGTMAAADISSMSVGPATSSSIRDLDAGPATQFFFSSMQFHATAGCLIGIRRFSIQFIYVWIIQLNAFLMTIRRKNLASHSALVTTYGLMLLFGLYVASYEYHRLGMLAMATTIGSVASTLRIGLRVPKYRLWIGMAVLTQFARPTVEEGHPLATMWPHALAASLAVHGALGVYKVRSKTLAAAATKKTDAPTADDTPHIAGTPATAEYSAH